jgi:5'-3' exoribonuclease 1
MFEEIKFELGLPLTPFQQLMGCLPPGSSALVPKPHRWLMTSPESPILHFYPETFVIDMNGKKNPWEGVNLLPFIDVNLLKKSIEEYCPDSKLSPAERERNSFGSVYAYKYDPTSNDFVPTPTKKIGFADIQGSHSSETFIEEDAVTGGGVSGFKAKLLEGTKLPYPGFPSLNVLPIAKKELIKVGLNCFGSNSKYFTMMLTLQTLPELPPLATLAQTILHQSLFINWPMMHEGRVVAISDSEQEIRKSSQGELIVKKHSAMSAQKWATQSMMMQQSYHVGNGVPGSGGIDIGDINIRLKLLPLQGMKMNPSNGAKKKLFGKQEADVPLQLVLWQAPAPDPRFQERGPMTLQDRFPLNKTVVITKGKYRGFKGEVLGIADDKKSVGVKVQTIPPEIPFGLAIARSVQESFVSSYDAARILKMSSSVLGKITARLSFEQGRYDLGLNLKNPADGTCVVGYTRRKPENANANAAKVWTAGDSLLVVGSKGEDDSDDREGRIQWEYTPKAIKLVELYRKKFPQLFSQITKNPNEKRYNANAIFGPNGEAWLPVIREWLDSVETATLPRTPLTTASMSYEAVAAVQKAADVRTLALKKKGYPKDSVVKIPGSALYLEGMVGASDVLSATDLNKGEAPELGDRVVNLNADGIPFGARGTVVGIHEATTTGSVEVVMDEEFIGGTTLQGACSNFRGKLCVWAHLLKVTPENSTDLVNRMVPKGSGRGAVNKIISSIDKDASTTAAKTSNPDVTPEKQREQAKTPTTPATSVSSHEESRTPPASRSASASRATNSSAGRAKQGAWREAKRPPEKGMGFNGKGKRKGSKSGLERWRASIKNTNETKAAANLKSMLGVTSQLPKQKSASAELKSMLGVTAGASSAPPPPSPADAASNATEGLKAMLGVRGAHNPPQQSATDAAGLKAMLGVSGGQPAPPPPAPAAPPSNAAEQLMRMMANTGLQQQQAMPPQYPMAPPRSAFNFTYVEEGMERGPPPPAMMPAPPPFMPYGMHPNGMPPMPPNGMSPNGMPPYAYGMPPPAHMLPPPQFMGGPQSMPSMPPTPIMTPPTSGPNMAEFPPLGAEPAAAPPPVVAPPKPAAKAGPLVPSAVLKR